MFGKIKFYDEAKGFGFITCDDGADVFLGSRELQRRGISPPRPGARLCFEVVVNARGKSEATKVTLIDEPAEDERGDEPRRRAERIWTNHVCDEV
jgi:CspA family cold shock protein